MAAYPVDQGGKGSKIRVFPAAGIRFTNMSDGALRGFRDYTEEVYQITVEHFWLNNTDRDAIIAHYDAGPTTLHTVTKGSDIYDVYYTNKPQIPDEEGPLSMVLSSFIGTLQ